MPGRLRVAIAGHGLPDEVAALQAQIDRLGVADVVTLLGRRD